ncbi:hypothetical protein TNCV_684271 [Trichonephila clavipes]|nr:hypothetical protein TNCV_684271 [Trichonephila clavipes]
MGGVGTSSRMRWPSLVDSRFGRRGSMTSNVNWSDRTDLSAPPQSTSTGLGASSPPHVNAGDEYIAEHSDLFREAICARNVYAAWARKLTNARPNDPKMQSYHQEVTMAASCTQSCFPVAQSDGKERKEKAHISNISNCLHLSQLASLDKNNALREIKLRLSYLQGKSTTMSVIAHQTEKEWISANKKSRQRMSQTQAEGAAEQHADRLEDAHLRAHHSCFTTSERC